MRELKELLTQELYFIIILLQLKNYSFLYMRISFGFDNNNLRLSHRKKKRITKGKPVTLTVGLPQRDYHIVSNHRCHGAYEHG